MKSAVRLLFIISGVLLMLLAVNSCTKKDSSNTSSSEVQIYHTGSKIFKHGEGFKKPLENCTKCHGTDLKGSGEAISCFTCHENKWNYGTTSHEIYLNGYSHASGFQILNNETCIVCHGSKISASKVAQNCYGCHFDTFDLTTSPHTKEFGNTLSSFLKDKPTFHALSLQTPAKDCIQCHGADLKGTASASSCYICHGEFWNIPDDHNTKGEKARHPTKELNNIEYNGCVAGVCTCVNCHGVDLKGGEVAASCYQDGCHRQGAGFNKQVKTSLLIQ